MRQEEEREKGRSLAQQLDRSHCNSTILLNLLIKSERVFFFFPPRTCYVSC